MLIAYSTPNGFQTTGYSMNIDYMPLPNAVVRLEGKTYHSKDAIFVNGRAFSANSPLITASIGVSF
jgi:hypothetical protein